MRNKKAFVPAFLLQIALIIGMVAGIIAIAEYSGINLKTLQGDITGSGSYIERPVFKYIKCEALGSLKYSQEYQLTKDGEWLIKPSVTNYYNVILKGSSTIFGEEQFNYYICNSKTLSSSGNCRIYNAVSKGISLTISNIKPEEYVWVQYQRYVAFQKYALSGATYQISFIPYGLREYDVLSGSANQINPNNCETPSNSDSWIDRFISTDSSKIKSIMSKNTNERILQPEEVRWYVSGYVTSAASSFILRYQGYDAWCRTTGITGEIYRINTITVGSGTYKIASPDWSDYLGSVTCCPKSIRGDEVCQDDFSWKKIGGSECGAFKSCGSSNFVPYSENQIIKYKCVDGYCKSEIQDVECASDYDCKADNKVCDLNSWKCVDANVNLKGQEIQEVADNQADCEAHGGRWITEKTTKSNWYNYLGFGEPEIIINEYCKYPMKWYWWLLIIAGIILAIPLFIKFIFPLIKRFIPL